MRHLLLYVIFVFDEAPSLHTTFSAYITSEIYIFDISVNIDAGKKPIIY